MEIIKDYSFIELWKSDLRLVKRGEQIRIVSGEIPCRLAEVIKDDIKRVNRVLHAKIKIIAGPIISVDDKTRTNAIFELADEDVLELWISPFRQLCHYRIFGDRLIYREDYHEPLSPDRVGRYIEDRIAISKYIYDFDNLVDSLDMKRYSESTNAIKKTSDEIIALRKKLGTNYDFLISNKNNIELAD